MLDAQGLDSTRILRQRSHLLQVGIRARVSRGQRQIAGRSRLTGRRVVGLQGRPPGARGAVALIVRSDLLGAGAQLLLVIAHSRDDGAGFSAS